MRKVAITRERAKWVAFVVVIVAGFAAMSVLRWRNPVLDWGMRICFVLFLLVEAMKKRVGSQPSVAD